MPRKDIIAKDKQHAFELIRQDLRNWNREAHEEDQMTFLDWLGEMAGPTPVYGYRVVRDNSTESGFDLIRVAA